MKPLFLQSAGALFEAYHKYSSATDWSTCEQILHLIMDYPDQALRRGTHTQQKQMMDQTTEEIHEKLRRVNSNASAACPANSGHPQPPTTQPAPEPTPQISSPPAIHITTPNLFNTIVIPDDPESPQGLSTSGASHAEQQEMKESAAAAAEADSTNPFDEEWLLKAVRRAKSILRAGGPRALSRAAKALSESSLAPMDSKLKRTLRTLHPKAKERIGPLPVNKAPGTHSLDILDKVLPKRIHNGSSPGPSGWTGSHMMAIWTEGTATAKEGLRLLIRDIANGVFGGDTKKRLLACKLIPINKNSHDSSKGVRPVAVGEVFVKAAAHCMMALIEDDLPSFFPAIQYGVKRSGGSESAAHLIRNILSQTKKDHATQAIIALKTDFMNAFNCANRKLVWEALLRHPKAAPILKAFHYQYADPTPLLVFDSTHLFDSLESDEGVRQGCPFAGFGFALLVQPLYEQSIKAATQLFGVSIQDDLTIIGPADRVFLAYQYILKHAIDYGLQLRPEKCQVFIPPETAATCAEATLQAIHAECKSRNLSHQSSMEALGVMFGTDADIESHCSDTVDSSENFFAALAHPEMPASMAFSLLRYCGVTKLGFAARTIHPDRLDTASLRFDAMVQQTLLKILKLTDESLSSLESAPTEEKDDGAQLAACTREQLLMRMSLPISAGGLGIRPIHRVRHAAYYSSLLQILPDFLRLFPTLSVNEESVTVFGGIPSAVTQSDIFIELSHCRSNLLEQGAGCRRSRRQLQRASAIPSHVASAASDPPDPPDPQRSATATALNSSSAAPAVTRAPIPITPAAAAAAPIVQPAAAVLLAPFPDFQPSSPIAALQKSTEEIWQSASSSATVVVGQHFVLASKLQQALTAGIESTLYTQCYNSCQLYQQTILTSLSENPNCSAFLTVLPTRPEYRMTDDQFLLACRHRLGMLPFDDLIDEVCVKCHGRNDALPSFRADPDHLHACLAQTGSSITERHHRVVDALADAARSVGYRVQVEPHFEPVPVQITDPDTGVTRTEADSTLLRGDLLLVKGNERLLIDVVVNRPTKMTNLHDRTLKVNSVPLASTAAAEKRKHDKYDALCQQRGLKMIAFGVETYGALGKEAIQLLNHLAGKSDEITADSFLSHNRACINVALQCGNSEVASRGTQAQRCQQLRFASDDTAGMLGQTQAASRRRQTRHRAELARTPVAIGGYHSSYHATAPPGRYSALIACETRSHSHSHPHSRPHPPLSPEQGELPRAQTTSAGRALAGGAA